MVISGDTYNTQKYQKGQAGGEPGGFVVVVVHEQLAASVVVMYQGDDKVTGVLHPV